jgi:hypothetical protein
VQWRVVPDGPFFGPYWCHGAAGIGQFLVHAASHDALGAAELAQQAADSVARARWTGPGQCHGLAGSIEFLLDVYRRTGLESRRNQAAVLGRLLLPFLPEPLLPEPSRPVSGPVPSRAPPSRPVPSGPVEAVSARLPDGYMFGLAGMLAALLRLADPAGRPRQLAGCGPQAQFWQAKIR